MDNQQSHSERIGSGIVAQTPHKELKVPEKWKWPLANSCHLLTKGA
jgi:hypothetical protein